MSLPPTAFIRDERCINRQGAPIDAPATAFIAFEDDSQTLAYRCGDLTVDSWHPEDGRPAYASVAIRNRESGLALFVAQDAADLRALGLAVATALEALGQ